MTTLSPSAHRRALKRKLTNLQGKLTVVKREIAEIQAQEKPTTPGLRALREHKRQLERVVELLEGELWGK